MSSTAIILDVGSVATAVGVGTAVVQLWLSRRQVLTGFEDALTKEYRRITAQLPIDAFLDGPLPDEQLEEHRSGFYTYFDLCNEQVFLRSAKRISQKTWEQWRDGIQKNLQREAFRRAWNEHFDRQTSGDFDELRQFMRDYAMDPASWASGRARGLRFFAP